jgi:shikimate kinase
MDKKPIVLIGFMGSGKTTIGKELALLLPDYQFFDLDSEIESLEKKTIAEIFSTYGEDHFRQKESLILQKKLQNNSIISTGGGIILDIKNREFIKENGFVVWLYANEDNIYNRIKNEKHRPLINTNESKEFIMQKIKKILTDRFDHYKNTSHIIINTNKYTPKECANEIIKDYKFLE